MDEDYAFDYFHENWREILETRKEHEDYIEKEIKAEKERNKESEE